MSKVKFLIFSIVVVGLVGCGNSSSDNPPSPTPVTPVDQSLDDGSNPDGVDTTPIPSGQTVTLTAQGEGSECKAGIQSTAQMSEQEQQALFDPLCQQAGEQSFQSLQNQCQQKGGILNQDAQFDGGVSEANQGDCLLLTCTFTATGSCSAQ